VSGLVVLKRGIFEAVAVGAGMDFSGSWRIWAKIWFRAVVWLIYAGLTGQKR